MAKMPTAKEVLSDPKYGEQKGFFKELFSGLVDEMRAESDIKKRGKKKEDNGGNFWDDFFGPDED